MPDLRLMALVRTGHLFRQCWRSEESSQNDLSIHRANPSSPCRRAVAVTSGCDTRLMPINAPLIHNEREGLLAFLEHQRQAVRFATFGLHDYQARLKPGPSGLSLGGLVKHLVHGERSWTDRIEGVPLGDNAFEIYTASFVFSEDDSLAAAPGVRICQ
jgi:hypothetical protein